MNNYIECEIEPPIQLKPQTSCKIQIRILEIVIFKYVKLVVDLVDDNSKFLDRLFYVLEGDDYNNWEIMIVI